jgi:hypothetical protein
VTKPKTSSRPAPGIDCGICGLPGLIYAPFAFRAGEAKVTRWALGCRYCGARVLAGKPYMLGA